MGSVVVENALLHLRAAAFGNGDSLVAAERIEHVHIVRPRDGGQASRQVFFFVLGEDKNGNHRGGFFQTIWPSIRAPGQRLSGEDRQCSAQSRRGRAAEAALIPPELWCKALPSHLNSPSVLVAGTDNTWKRAR